MSERNPNDSPNLSGNPRYWCQQCRHWCELYSETCVTYCLGEHARKNDEYWAQRKAKP